MAAEKARGVKMGAFARLQEPNLILVLALSIFAWAPLLTPGYFFEAHDAKHSVFFLVEFDQTFRDGYWWPRWAPDFAFGYGYPLFNLYAPLAFYAAQMLHLFGLGFTTAIKTMYVLATLGGGVGMYYFARRLYGSTAGVLAAVVYMYVPFHLVEIYVRSAYAEFISLALIPFLFLAFTELIARPNRRRLALAGLAYGLLALTHHTSFFTFSPFLMVYLLYLILAKAKFNLKALMTHGLYAAAAGLLGLALAAIYLLPVIVETRYIKVEQWTSGSYNYLQHFVYFSQLFEENWGYGYAGPGTLDDFSYQLGVVVVVLLIFAFVTSLRARYPHRATTFFFLVSTLIIVLLMSPLAQPVWQIIPIASLVQFPWRLLAVTAFTMSIAAGALGTEQLMN
ncbi:MAG TPA: 6-pyruvoyl-tetrahydropterin synthase-related protein, partial [Anaerolineae bacterium]|nr:6-pyruvoyl-tetrahydropterin synthase-related protein [Anaerolineae bacterium]